MIIGVYGLAAEGALATPRPYYRAEHDLLAHAEFRRRYRLRVAKTSLGYFPYFARISNREG